MGLRRLHGVDALPGPGKALLAHLGEEGAPPRPVLPLRLLDAPSDQHQDHLAGQGQVVIQGEQDLQVIGRQPLAQAALHLVRQGGEGGARLLEGGSDVWVVYSGGSAS